MKALPADDVEAIASDIFEIEKLEDVDRYL